MKKIWAGILLGAWAAGFGLADSGPKRFQIAFSGGEAFITAYGSALDYQSGENDFPVTPKHSVFAPGLSLRCLFSPRFGIEAAGVYYPKSKLTLTDPSDGDIVEMTAAAHVEVTANIVFFAVRSDALGVYFVLGGGLDKISPRQETVRSANGWDVLFATPDKTTDPLILAGIGAESDLSGSFGLKGDFRYRILLASPDHIKSMSFSLGLFLRF